MRWKKVAAVCWALMLCVGSIWAQERPNILWLVTEDMSSTLGVYGDEVAVTPRIDAFAREGVRWTRAFATAPVCSPSRSCLITGMYATSMGTQRLRSSFALPQGVRGFPEYLRRAGYFTTNNVKTDYNTSDEAELIARSWDRNGSDAHWRQRGEGQPFFSVFNFMITHQSRTSVWSWEQFEEEIGKHLSPAERTDPAGVIVPPYYPDTPLVRRTMARYYDTVRAMDREYFGKLLDELEADGLAEDTIVFFYSDHGSGMPRHKRLLYDTGMAVPLIVRFPEKWRHLAPAGPGETVGELVSFVDFAPTVLRLAGLDVPGYMQGRAFLPAGEAEGSEREYVYGARDRVDEAYDVSRSVRDKRWLYVRNYMPHVSLNQPEGYSDASGMRREMAEMAGMADGEGLSAAVQGYVGPGKAAEELFDTLADPFQLNNLAGEAGYGEVLDRMRGALHDRIFETRDLGFMPEHEAVVRSAGESPRDVFADDEVYDLESILAAAELVGGSGVMGEQIALLRESDDAAVRYWAAVGLRAQRVLNGDAVAALYRALGDDSPSVRIEAAGALAAYTSDERLVGVAFGVLSELVRDKRGEVALHAARTIQMLGDRAGGLAAGLRPVLEDATERAGDDFYRFYTQFALEPAVGGKRWWEQ